MNEEVRVRAHWAALAHKQQEGATAGLELSSLPAAPARNESIRAELVRVLHGGCDPFAPPRVEMKPDLKRVFKYVCAHTHPFPPPAGLELPTLSRPAFSACVPSRHVVVLTASS